MFIRIGYDIEIGVETATPTLLMLHVHPDRVTDLTAPDTLNVEPQVPVHHFIDTFGNNCSRLVAPEGVTRFFASTIIEDDGRLDECNWFARQHTVDELPDDVLPFLLASRYCEVDEMLTMAWDLFSGIPEGWARVHAICDWVHKNVAFDYQRARSTKTAVDVYTERVGVCRDFTHLAVTLCRAMAIPARYCNGYLGDIGVAPDPSPMDFNAWFEAYLGGQWYTFDARHNEPRIGRVLIARGRDAADIPMITTYGKQTLNKFEVYTEQIPGLQMPVAQLVGANR